MTPQLWLLDDQQPKIVPAIERLRQAALVSQDILRFLRDATDTLGLQFRALGPVELQFMGFTGGFEFDNLLQLAQLCDQSRDGSGAILSVLRYICCIGELLWYVVHSLYLRWSYLKLCKPPRNTELDRSS